MKHALAITVLVLAGGCGPPADTKLQGYVEGEFVRMAAPFAGTLVRLDVQRGSRVEPGMAVFALEAEQEAASRREAQEGLERARAQLENLRKGRRPTEVDVVKAQLAQAEALAKLSQSELGRREDLVEKSFVSRQQLDEAQAAVARDRARVAELRAQLQTARLAARPDEIRAAEAEVAAAVAVLEQADWRLRQKSVVATVGGVVTDTLFVRGEWVGAGQPVVTLLPAENVKARFFVPEPLLSKIKVGDAIELRCDGCGEAVQAAVTYIAPQAEYTPPVIYSRETRARLVYLVEAKPALANASRLKPGQPLDVVLR